MTMLARPARVGWNWLLVVPAAGIATVATIRLINVARYLVAADAVAVAIVGGIGLPLAAVMVLAARRAPADRPSAIGIGAVAILYGGLRILAAVGTPAPVTGDWERYHRIAVSIAADGLRFDIVPTGFPAVLAAAYRLFGTDPAVGQGLQIVLGAGIGALVYLIAARGWNHRVALGALVLAALAPSQILIGAVLATEPLYTLLLLAAVLLLIGPPTLSAWVAIGVVLGASQYVRATSVALLPFLAAVAWHGAGSDRSWRAPATIIGTFLLVLVPVIVWNWATLGSPSVSTSRVGNFSLMVGLNQEAGGRWNPEDFALVGNRFGSAESERVAGEVARERLRSDPVGSVGLMVAKFTSWGREDYGAYWAIGVSGDNIAWRIGALASQAWWAIVSWAATVAVLRWWWRHRLVATTGLLVIAVTLVHAVLETQGRYHSYLVPLFAVLAAAVLGEVGRRIPEDAVAE